MCGPHTGGVIRGPQASVSTLCRFGMNFEGAGAKYGCEKVRYTGSFRLITDKPASTDPPIFAAFLPNKFFEFAGLESQNDGAKNSAIRRDPVNKLKGDARRRSGTQIPQSVQSSRRPPTAAHVLGPELRWSQAVGGARASPRPFRAIKGRN